MSRAATEPLSRLGPLGRQSLTRPIAIIVRKAGRYTRNVLCASTQWRGPGGSQSIFLSATSISVLLDEKTGTFMRAANRMTPPDDMLRGRVDGPSHPAPLTPPRPSKGLDERLGVARRFGFRKSVSNKTGAFDTRQRAIVKRRWRGRRPRRTCALRVSRRRAARSRTRRSDVTHRTNGFPRQPTLSLTYRRDQSRTTRSKFSTKKKPALMQAPTSSD